MPTPIEILLDPISLGVLALYGALMVCEAIAPGRNLPMQKGWVPRAIGSFVVYFYLASYLPLVWNGYLSEYQLFDLSGLGWLAGAAIGLLGRILVDRVGHNANLLLQLDSRLLEDQPLHHINEVAHVGGR